MLNAHKPTAILCLMLLSSLLCQSNAVVAGGPPKAGESFPSIGLPAPGNVSHGAYLGIGDRGTFNLEQIDAQVLVIEIFSMYCPYCQREAPLVNRLFETVESNPRLNIKVKLLGIGVGNSPFEVDIFRKKYRIRFPLIPDPDYKVHKMIGEVRTPYFFVLCLVGGNPPKVIYSKLGGIGDIDKFMNIISSALSTCAKE